MRTFIQLKDGIGWASVNTTGEIEDCIEVEPGTGDFYIKKKYENGSWVEAPLIYFVTQLIDNMVHQVSSTVFSSDVTGDIVSEDCKYGWIKNPDGTYSAPTE